MELSRSKKLLLGILTLWPPVYMVMFISFIFIMIFSARGGGSPNPVLLDGFAFIFIAHFLTMLLIFGLMIFYIVHAVKNTRLDGNMRIIWVILFLFGGVIAHPVYWYLEIWRVKTAESSFGQMLQSPANAEASDSQAAYAPPSEPPDWR